MILFDPDQPEAANGFPQLAVASGAVRPPVPGRLPTRPTLARYLREAQLAVGLKGEVSVLLTTDAGIRALNQRFRKKNKATDVLSFPVEAGFGLAGDLAISVETAARQASEQGHRLSVELRVLMLHGLLHLAGMDHETDDGKMARRERRLRAKLGLPMGLIERVDGREQRTETREQKSTSRFPSGMTTKKATAKTKTKATTDKKTKANTKVKAPVDFGTAASARRGAR